MWLKVQFWVLKSQDHMLSLRMLSTLYKFQHHSTRQDWDGLPSSTERFCVRQSREGEYTSRGQISIESLVWLFNHYLRLPLLPSWPTYFDNCYLSLATPKCSVLPHMWEYVAQGAMLGPESQVCLLSLRRMSSSCISSNTIQQGAQTGLRWTLVSNRKIEWRAVQGRWCGEPLIDFLTWPFHKYAIKGHNSSLCIH